MQREQPSKHGKIRVAYLSADFNGHAVATLLAGVCEQHDKSRFETTAISYVDSDGSAMRRRLERAFDRGIDVAGKSDQEVASAIRRLEIDIAVDLMGFTGECRPGILALRPAPLQVNFLGFPGTMGSNAFDYIIADPIVIPEEHKQHYSESVVHLPDSYLPADSARRIAARKPTRAEAGLPDEGFVFCSFNASYKFSPEIFDVWMRLLAAVERSVLWLPQMNAAAVRNLRAEAAKRGVSERRLVFAPFLREDEDHLARLGLADLFLDTLPYNAHSTAVDALWAGVPVLTMCGNAFAGRVASSVLTAAGLSDLITMTLEDYEVLALKLAREPQALAALRAKLEHNRDISALFDTVRYTRNLEAAYHADVGETAERASPGAFRGRFDLVSEILLQNALRVHQSGDLERAARYAALRRISSASRRISVAAAERGSLSVTPLPSIMAATNAVRLPSEAREIGMPAFVMSATNASATRARGGTRFSTIMAWPPSRAIISSVGQVAHRSIGLSCIGTIVTWDARTAVLSATSSCGGASISTISESSLARSIAPWACQPTPVYMLSRASGPSRLSRK